MNASLEKLRPTRSNVHIEARLARANGGTQDVLVDGLSIDGCSIQGWFTVGDVVVLQLPRIGTFNATVRWARGGRAGFRFDRAVPR